MSPRGLRGAIVGGLFALGTGLAFAAAPSLVEPTEGDDRAAGVDRVDTAAREANPAPQLPGNPLWAILLSDLAATRERPIFSPSRHPVPPAVVAAPYVPPPPPPKPVEPERPGLSLVGTIVGEAESIGIFLDQTTNKLLRLKTGERHRGWMLQSVLGRTVALQKDQETTTLELPAPSKNAPTVATRQ
jgi:hypothetical protein